MKYTIDITRTGYSTKSFEVEAETQQEAMDLAIEEAYNTSFVEDDADYDVINVRKTKKEIHFYTNLNNTKQASEYDLDNMEIDYFSTISAISDDKELIKTTQLCLLRNAWDYIDIGYRVFIHNDDKVLEVKEHMSGTNKDIKRGVDISRLLLGGLFGGIC